MSEMELGVRLAALVEEVSRHLPRPWMQMQPDGVRMYDSGVWYGMKWEVAYERSGAASVRVTLPFSEPTRMGELPNVRCASFLPAMGSTAVRCASFLPVMGSNTDDVQEIASALLWSMLRSGLLHMHGYWRETLEDRLAHLSLGEFDSTLGFSPHEPASSVGAYVVAWHRCRLSAALQEELSEMEALGKVVTADDDGTWVYVADSEDDVPFVAFTALDDAAEWRTGLPSCALRTSPC